jgi:hypothetical protein
MPGFRPAEAEAVVMGAVVVPLKDESGVVAKEVQPTAACTHRTQGESGSDEDWTSRLDTN